MKMATPEGETQPSRVINVVTASPPFISLF